jgi:hypothetical protein
MDTTICSNLLDDLSPDFEFEPRVRFGGDSVLINLGILMSHVNRLLNPTCSVATLSKIL